MRSKSVAKKTKTHQEPRVGFLAAFIDIAKIAIAVDAGLPQVDVPKGLNGGPVMAPAALEYARVVLIAGDYKYGNGEFMADLEIPDDATVQGILDRPELRTLGIALILLEARRPGWHLGGSKKVSKKPSTKK